MNNNNTKYWIDFWKKMDTGLEYQKIKEINKNRAMRGETEFYILKNFEEQKHEQQILAL